MAFVCVTTLKFILISNYFIPKYKILYSCHMLKLLIADLGIFFKEGTLVLSVV